MADRRDAFRVRQERHDGPRLPPERLPCGLRGARLLDRIAELVQRYRAEGSIPGVSVAVGALAAQAGIVDGGWMVIETPRAEIEARVLVTVVGGRVVHAAEPFAA